MIFILIFIALSACTCETSDGQAWCADESGLILCLRAQDQVNTLIRSTRDSTPLLQLNCSQFIVADDWHWQSRYRTNFWYSKNLNSLCYSAMEVFDRIVKQYAVNDTTRIECEIIEGSKYDSNDSTMRLSLKTHTFIFLTMLFLQWWLK